jgi:eukaryotic-like serine/threonine-protein kinase
VALKVMREGVFAGGMEVARFRQEVSAAAALRHPGIVLVFESGECEGRFFYAMEWIDGPNLAEQTREHPASPKDAARWVREVAGAMQSRIVLRIWPPGFSWP